MQINASKKPANTHFHEERDKCNTELFFLANKKTDFFSNENPFLKFQKYWHLEVVFMLSISPIIGLWTS